MGTDSISPILMTEVGEESVSQNKYKKPKKDIYNLVLKWYYIHEL